MYSSIYKEFICNLDGILHMYFHLKSLFDKNRYIFDQTIWEYNCMHNFDLIVGFQILYIGLFV